jgi:hypothetical protein
MLVVPAYYKVFQLFPLNPGTQGAFGIDQLYTKATSYQ